MPAPESRSSGAPPVLASFLLGGGLACAAAGLWLRGGDVTGWVERKIAGARGSMSAETAAWLQDNPPSSLLLLAGLALAGLGGLYLFLRSRLQPGLARLSAGTNAKWDCAVAGLVVIAWYFPTLPSGYFRYDDFELLTVARESGFRATLWQPHGDHVLPLTRVLAWAGLTFFGTSAWPYNLWLWLSMVGVVIAGMLLLTEMKVSRPARWIFAGLVIFWNPWAEMMTGYYILSTYLLIAVLGLAAAWCYLRWRRSGGTHWAAALAGCVLLAPLVDVSGAYVIGLAGVFLARDLADRPGANGFRAWLHEHRRVLGGLALATTISGACLLHAYRVVNPGVFLGMAGGEQRTLFQLARDLGYLLGAGTLLSMATPFVYARLPAALLGALTAAVCLPALFYFGAAWRAADRSRRLLLGAIFLVVLGAGLMVALGRAPTDTWI
ncbi:MAG TPA: hypothetical protein VHN79_12835, partial [Lacunisphaera sp.]|nr:hypothetical protein [Lacunisphaera sp.]